MPESASGFKGKSANTVTPPVGSTLDAQEESSAALERHLGLRPTSDGSSAHQAQPASAKHSPQVDLSSHVNCCCAENVRNNAAKSKNTLKAMLAKMGVILTFITRAFQTKLQANERSSVLISPA